MVTKLEQSLLKTISMFSIFSYPATEFQVWKWLITPDLSYRLETVRQVLHESDWLKEKISFTDGFYTLKGQEDLVKTRHERFFAASQKIKRARQAARYLGIFPFIKAVYVGNTLAWMNTKEESDIDLFVVAKAGSLWLTRLVAVAPFAILGLRPKAGVRHPLCFSFFASDSALDFRDLRIDKDDWYLALWIRSLVPLFSNVDSILQKENGWTQKFFPNSFSVRSAKTHRITPYKFPYFPVWGLEAIAKFIQTRRLPKELKQMANQDSRVVINDCRLKFHPNDRRQAFAEELQTLCARF